MKTTILLFVVSRFSTLFVITLPDVHFRMKGVITQAGSPNQPGKGFFFCCYVQLNGITAYIPFSLIPIIYSLSGNKEMNALINMGHLSLECTNLNQDPDHGLIFHPLTSDPSVCQNALCLYVIPKNKALYAKLDIFSLFLESCYMSR